MFRGHLGGRSRKRETGVEHRCVLECPPECSPPTRTLETRLNFRQKKYVVDGVKGLGKTKVDNINCVTLVHNARHRFLEDQQIGETGPTG